MRTSHQDKGWVEDPNGRLIGVALGFDFCAEHEQGARPFYRSMNVNTDVLGFDRMVARRAPPVVRFDAWTERKPKANQRARQDVDPDKLKHAALHVAASPGQEEPLRELVKRHIVPVNPTAAYYSPERDDIGCAWDEGTALIWVRGAANVARLQEIHAAILAQDLVLNAPVQSGFVRRGGLSFGIASRFSEEFKKDLLESDRYNARLEKAVIQSGVRDLLKENKIGYYALTPAWHDAERERGLLFFLNPMDQRRNHADWFTLDEIEQWAKGTGPVIKDAALAAAEKAFETAHGGKSATFLFSDAARGNGLTYGHLRVAWADEAKTRVGVAVRAKAEHARDKTALPSGVYDLENFLAHPQPELTETVSRKRRRSP